MKTQTTNYPRILIIGTTPYSPEESSRALDTYFHNWPKENLRMIFSNANKPIKGLCDEMYQVTDYDVLDAFLGKIKAAGRIYKYKDLDDKTEISEKTSLNKFKKKSTLRYYLRKALWKKKWKSLFLDNWVKEFDPEIVYICFSDDYFILDIADYYSSVFNIPVIAQIGDDYYFQKSNNPLLKPYRKKYLKLFDKIMNKDGFGVYISDKLASKYNGHFKLQGSPFYLSSGIIAGTTNDIKYEFNYFGKINLGRHKSLGLLGNALRQIDKNYCINVYTSETNKKMLKYLVDNGCVVKTAIPYKEVVEIMNSGSFNIIASGFSEKDIEQSRYSLSTKVSDVLSSPGPIIAVGGKGDGAIDFFEEKECAITLTKGDIDVDGLKSKLNDIQNLVELRNKALKVSEQLFDSSNNRALFEQKCRELIKEKE